MRIILLIVAVVMCLLQTNSVFANVVGPDPENFNPTTDGLDFVTVQSSETLEPGIINFGLFLDYGVNTLPHFDNLVNYNRVNLNDFLLFSHLAAGVGLGKNWDVGISLPILLKEDVRNDQYSGLFYSTGLSSIDINTKYRLTGDNNRGVALLASANINTLDNNPYTGTGAKPTYNLEAVYDNTFGLWAAAVNFGYRIRQPGTPLPNIPLQPFRNQFIGSLAASYLLINFDTKIIFELFGSYPSQEVQFQSNRSLSSLEALLGVKHDFTHNLAFHAGGGTGIFQGTSSPDWRIYVGLNWTLGPIMAKQEVAPPVPMKVSEEKHPEKPESFTTSDLIFEFNSDKLSEEGLRALDELSQYLKKPPKFKHLAIGGHTDSIGSVAYNQNLSERRANNVKKALVEKFGLDAKNIEAIGYGPSRPIADNGNYQGRKKNRRVEFIIDR